MKKTIAFLLAAILLLSLCACGKDKQPAEETAAPVAEPTSKPDEQPEAAPETPAENDQPAQRPDIQVETPAPEEQPEAAEETADGLRPEFKDAMDSYEAFYTEYCSFLKKYQEEPSDLGLLSDYAAMMTKASEVDANFRAWDQETMNDAELKYYLEVNGRVLQMIADATTTD